MVMKVLSLIVIGFWLVSSFAATVREENMKTRIITLVMFISTIIPFYYVYMR